jgi:predicted P-loop ATPase
MSDWKMVISVGKSRKDIRWRNVEMSWDAFLDRLRDPYRSHETVKEYKAMTKDEKSRAKDVGGFVGGEITGGHRKADNVKNRCMVTLDLDDAGEQAWEDAAMWGWTCACYSTHSHTPEKPRLRLVFPLDRAVNVDEYQAIARRVAEYVGIEQMDVSTYEPSRLMYWPSCPRDGEYVFREQEGVLLGADETLASYGRDDAWRDSRLWPTAKTEDMVRIREVKRQGDPAEKPGIVGLFCRTYDIPSAIDTFLPEVYVEGDKGRYTFVAGSTADGAVLYDDGAFMYSHHGTDPCGGKLVNAFDLVRIHLFGDLDDKSDEDTDITKTASYKRMCEFAAEDDGVKATAAREKMDEVADKFGDLEDPGAGTDDNTGWESKLTVDKKTGEIHPTIQNACILLRNLPDFKDKLGYNPMSDVITVKGELPWWGKQKYDRLEDMFNDADDPHAPEPPPKLTQDGEFPWTDNDWPSFYAYFEDLGFQTRGQRNGVLDNALQIVSMENTYHPIRSYLAGLRWDGVKRLSTMFIRWLGAEDTELDREITRLWMIAGVDRVMRPGCQFDEMLITCGPQGLGKSRMLRMLARGFFTNSITAMNMEKSTAEKLQGMWIVELGELDGMKKSEQTQIKNFITSTDDRYRGAYARAAVTHPRQCILAGTSNEASFLRDSTGERRYWIMPVKGTGDRGEMKGFKDEVDQLWAEAVVLWKHRMMEYRAPGQRLEDVELCLYLKDPRLDAQMTRRQMNYKMPEEDREEVEGYLDTLRPVNWYEMSAQDRRDFACGDWIGDSSACTLQINKISVKELRCEMFRERQEDTGRRSSRSLRLVDILDSTPGWRKGGKGRDAAYGSGVHQYWVRIGSPEDKDPGSKGRKTVS